MAQVTGVPILGLIKFIKRNMKDALPGIIGLLPPDLKRYMDERIEQNTWYPYELYTGLLHALDKVAGTGDLSYCVEQGRLSARHDLSTIYKIFVSVIDVKQLIPRAMTIWNGYYDTGTVEAGLVSDNELVITIKDFPGIDKAHIKNAQGWLEQFLIMCRYTDVKSTITKCQCFGDPVTELRLTGKPR